MRLRSVGIFTVIHLWLWGARFSALTEASRTKLARREDQSLGETPIERKSRSLQELFPRTGRRNATRFAKYPQYRDFPEYLPISAVHDAPDQKVIINAIVTEEFIDEVVECLFSEAYSMENPIVLGAYAQRYSQRYGSDWTEYKITCMANGSSLTGLKAPFADVRLRNGTRGNHPVRLEVIDTVEKEGVALCGTTIYSQRLWLQDYVRHYETLGVDEFHFCLVEGPVVDNFLSGKETTEGVYVTTPASLSKKKQQPFSHPKVRWHNFTASPGSTSFDHRACYNDCLSRLKYSHKYAVVADADEFFHITKRAEATSIREIMDRYLPEGISSLSFADVHYPRDCATSKVVFDEGGMVSAWDGLYPDNFHLHFGVSLFKEREEEYWASGPNKPDTLPLKLGPFNQWVKSIVRVNNTWSVHAHGPDEIAKTATAHNYFMPHFMVHFKHIRRVATVPCIFGSTMESNTIFQPAAVLHLMDA